MLTQLRRQGVLQAVGIIQAGFPQRIFYREIHSRYAPLLQALASRADGHADTRALARVAPRPLVCALLAAEELREGHDYVLGRARVFLRLGKAQALERLLTLPPAELLADLETRLLQHAARLRAKIVVRQCLRKALVRRRRLARLRVAAALTVALALRRKLARRRVAARRAEAAALAEAARRAEEEEAAAAARAAEAAARAAEAAAALSLIHI